MRRSRSRTSTTKAELLDFAESPAAHAPITPDFMRFADERYVVLLGATPEFTSIQRPRFPEDGIEETLDEIRDLVSRHGHRNAKWWIPDSATPSDLADRLLELGLRPDEKDPDLTAMTLEQLPPEPPRDISVRAVSTEEEMAEAMAIQWDAFAISDSERAEQGRRVADRFRLEREYESTKTFLAWVDGRPAAAALAVFAPQGGLLVGGSTQPWARGRGAYRALVRARWDAAVARGTPTLVVQAGSMSGPIVRRLGFVPVSRIRHLVDVAGAA